MLTRSFYELWKSQVERAAEKARQQREARGRATAEAPADDYAAPDGTSAAVRSGAAGVPSRGRRSRMSAVKSLDAVVLIVKDLEAQKRFYSEVLGLPLWGEYADAVFFECGEQKLALFAHSHHPEGTQRLEGAAKGISHLEFGIAREDYPALKERLEGQGFYAYGDNFCDADGNLFHFNVT